MKVISVKEIARGGVSRVVRDAEREPVLVSRDDEPAVWMISARELARIMNEAQPNTDPRAGAAALIALHLFDLGAVSLGRAAHLAGLALPDFIALCDSMGVAVFRAPEGGIGREVDAFASWLAGVEPSDGSSEE